MTARKDDKREGRLDTVPRLALSVEEAAASLGVSRDFFDEHVAAEIRLVRRGRRKLVPVAELERWVSVAASRPIAGVGLDAAADLPSRRSQTRQRTPS